MNVKIPTLVEKSQSRKVNKVVELTLKRNALHAETARVVAELEVKRGTLNGSQLGEVAKLLEGY